MTPEERTAWLQARYDLSDACADDIMGAIISNEYVAVAEEREACALIAREIQHAAEVSGDEYEADIVRNIYEAIRMRARKP